MMTSLARTARRLLASSSGVAMTEFALTFPFLLGVSLMGIETANRVLVQMKVTQLANLIADNASRIGEQSVLEDRRIFEGDINDLFYGAQLQGGSTIDLYTHGRVILSSLEVVPDTEDQQYINWQRCVGLKNHTSSYGVEGDGESANDFPGMGPAGEEVIAFEDEAVMFVEISYDYQSIIGNPFTFDSGDITAVASYTVRADRDLTQIYQRSSSDPDPVAECSSFETMTGLGFPDTSGGSSSSSSTSSSTTSSSSGSSGGTSSGGASSGGASSGGASSGGASSGGASSGGASSGMASSGG